MKVLKFEIKKIKEYPSRRRAEVPYKKIKR